MKWTRESYLSHLCFEGSDREMIVELFGLLLGTEERWKEQGASPEEIDLTAFAWDRVDSAIVPINNGPYSGFEQEILKETDTERIMRDTFGRRTILPKKVATIELPMDFPLNEPEDWKHIREWFRYEESRVDEEALQQCKRDREAGSIVRAGVWGAYDLLRNLMGDELACMAVLEEPEMVEDILQVMGDMQEDILQVMGDMQEACLKRVLQVVPIDYLFVHEDFAGKSGPLIGPNIIRNCFNPYYRRMWEVVEPHGARIYDLDSDGYVEPVIDALLESGINCLHPVEPGAGSDMVKIRKKYGSRLILRGGLDKFSLTKNKAAIDAELEYRLDPCLRGGGTMFGLDHRIPDGVTIEAYRYYVKRLREILDLPPVEADEPGWCRMA